MLHRLFARAAGTPARRPTAKLGSALALMASGRIDFVFDPSPPTPGGRAAYVNYQPLIDIPERTVNFTGLFFSNPQDQQVFDMAHEIGRLVGFSGTGDGPPQWDVQKWDNVMTFILPLWR